jgi:hypothetical protein
MRALSCVWVVVLLAGVARADKEDAKELYERGTAAYALQQYEEAAQYYERAFKLKPDPALLYNTAQAQRLAGNKKRALQLYQSYVKFYGTRVPNRVEVERIIVSLKAAIEVDQRASTSPPTETVAPLGNDRPYGPMERPVEKPPAAQPAPIVTAPPPAEEKKKTKPWVWGVAVGAGVGVAVILGVGLGVGLSSPSDPTASLGSIQAP